MPAKIRFGGILQDDDVAAVAEAGAASLGVVFAGGPRAVTGHGDQSPDGILEIVDGSSGVEPPPGMKDPHTIARFVEAVLAHSPVT